MQYVEPSSRSVFVLEDGGVKQNVESNKRVREAPNKEFALHKANGLAPLGVGFNLVTDSPELGEINVHTMCGEILILFGFKAQVLQSKCN
jgi:hypothetical protein